MLSLKLRDDDSECVWDLESRKKIKFNKIDVCSLCQSKQTSDESTQVSKGKCFYSQVRRWTGHWKNLQGR